MTGKFTREDFDHLLRERNNWGRWGDNDELGALNLITPAKRQEAAALVRSGRSVSLSRPFPRTPAPNNPYPAQQYLLRERFPHAGACIEYLGAYYHGYAATHVDALCHVWDDAGMWNGRDPDKEVDSFGARWGGVQAWRHGIVSRGVLLDVTAHRGRPFVTLEDPVHGHELEAICARQGVTVGAGDVLVVYSGRDRWDADPGRPVWGGQADGEPRAGLHASCLAFVRDHDVAAVAWDMLDLDPNEYGVRSTVHAAISAFGVALVDNCDLAGLVAACREEGRYEFMFMLAPLVVEGGTGSPANPLAIL